MLLLGEIQWISKGGPCAWEERGWLQFRQTVMGRRGDGMGCWMLTCGSTFNLGEIINIFFLRDFTRMNQKLVWGLVLMCVEHLTRACVPGISGFLFTWATEMSMSNTGLCTKPVFFGKYYVTSHSGWGSCFSTVVQIPSGQTLSPCLLWCNTY